MKRTALITGITGQDGSYLAQLLLELGYEVHGHSRRKLGDLGCAIHLAEHVTVHGFDIHNQLGWDRLLKDLQPAELYNFAADSFIPNSWNDPVATYEMNVGLPIRLMDAIRKHSPDTRFLNACSREIFGDCDQGLVNEDTPMNPQSIYGISKASSRWSVKAYRQQYDIFATNAILFNHESPRRPRSFVTRKITSAAARIANGLDNSLDLGNVHTQRDWGYAGDFVEAMWRMLQIDSAEDFVLGTGQLHSIGDFVSSAFEAAGLTWQKYIRTNPKLVRSIEPSPIAADTRKARELLDWQPTVAFPELVSMMVECDLLACRREVGMIRAA